jgi:hypothetical protein
MRHLIAAAAGVLVLAASASAQQPNQLPVIPIAPAGSIQPTSGTVRVPGETGPVRTFVMAGGGYYCSGCAIAQPACSNGCGSLRSDVNFVLGSSKSFFDPCTIGSYHHKSKCPGAGVYGRGGSGYNGCVYDSYLNH